MREWLKYSLVSHDTCRDCKALQEEIDSLKRQLKDKDKHLKEKDEEIERLHEQKERINQEPCKEQNIVLPLKAGVDLEFLPSGKIGGVESPSLAMLLIRTAVNRVSLKCQSLRQNSKFSAASELHFLINPKIIFLKPGKLDILCTNKLAARMPKIRIYYNH